MHEIQRVTTGRSDREIATDLDFAISTLADLIRLAKECAADESGHIGRSISALNAAERYAEDAKHINQRLYDRVRELNSPQSDIPA